MITDEKSLFINRHSLPEAYLEQASKWFDPIIESVSLHQKSTNKPLVLGINGCQGSGKTTLADYFSTMLKSHGLKSIAMSIDDFYLTCQQRKKLSADVHPLLATRGVPGTHDIPLALTTINALKNSHDNVSIPRFDKSRDDRFPVEKWPKVQAPIDVIIIEGWCMGIEAQEGQALVQSVNQLESLYDAGGTWRDYVNQQINLSYKKLWDQMDCLIMLQAPDFDCVYHWRLEQEQNLANKHKLAKRPTSNKIMSADQIRHFIQHYERLTRHSLIHLPKRCQHVFKLNTKRLIMSHHSPLSTYFHQSVDTSHTLNTGERS